MFLLQNVLVISDDVIWLVNVISSLAALVMYPVGNIHC